MDQYNKELLELLDDTIAPGGKVDVKAFDYFYNEFSENLQYVGEPSEEDEEAHEGWSCCTLKHQIFDYAPERPAGVGHYPKDQNDLPFVMAYWAEMDEEFAEDLMEKLLEYEN
jgi:hypothetical protein